MSITRNHGTKMVQDVLAPPTASVYEVSTQGPTRSSVPVAACILHTPLSNGRDHHL